MLEPDTTAPERRIETRLLGIFPILIRLKNFQGQEIELRTVADNLCSGGIYFQSPRALPTGAAIFTLIQISDIWIANRGKVLRTESKDYGMAGIAIRFTHTRYLPSVGR